MKLKDFLGMIESALYLVSVELSVPDGSGGWQDHYITADNLMSGEYAGCEISGIDLSCVSITLKSKGADRNAV